MEHHKKCPYCAEMIKAEAIVCRFCLRPMPGYEQAVPPVVPTGGRLEETGRGQGHQHAAAHLGTGTQTEKPFSHHPAARQAGGVREGVPRKLLPARRILSAMFLCLAAIAAVAWAVDWHAQHRPAEEVKDINEQVRIYAYDPGSGTRIGNIQIRSVNGWVANLQHGDAVTLLRCDGINCWIRTAAGDEGWLDCRLLNSPPPVVNVTPVYMASLQRFETLAVPQITPTRWVAKTPVRPTVSARPKERHFGNPYLVLTESEWKRLGGSSYIVGAIRNVSKRNYSYVQVEVNLYNAQGEQVGSTLDNVLNLNAGGVWRFQALITARDASRAEVVGITGY